ncbi:hypothetical protein [Sulfurimonas sp.]
MQWGLNLRIVSDFDEELWGLPPPSKVRWLSRADGKKILNILYHFEYMPQSWREWQRIASIKIQILQRVPKVEFMEYTPLDGIERVYTISELGKHFNKFVKFYKPLYPSDKKEFMRSLTLYCQRLHYEGQLHVEALIAMAFHFNAKGGYGYSHREVMKKTKSIMLLDMSKWRVKLTCKELQQAHVKGGRIAVEKKREKFQLKKNEGMELRKNGLTLQQIADELHVSLITVKRWKLSK